MGTIDLSDNSVRNKRERPVVTGRSSRSWYLLVGVTITTTIGLLVAVAPVLSEQLGSVWPWPNTHFVLLGGLAAAIISLVISLTVQQRRFSKIRGEVRSLEALHLVVVEDVAHLVSQRFP